MIQELLEVQFRGVKTQPLRGLQVSTVQALKSSLYRGKKLVKERKTFFWDYLPHERSELATRGITATRNQTAIC